MKAVDDNKNNLTYFVRVDWHLPERELTKKSEANLFFEHLKPCLLPCCENMSEKCVLPVSCFGMFWSGLIVMAIDDNKNNLTYFVRVDWHLPERELTKKSEANLCFEHLKTCLLPCCEFFSMSERNVCCLFVVLDCFGYF